MKKILSLVLVLALVLGTFSFAFAAPNDVAGTKYEDAVERLMTLGIVDGYEDGTIRPNQTIKREEFAKLMVVALGLEDLTGFAGNSTQFTDVPENSWAKGYINIAAAQGLVKGRGDGTFGYGDNITYAEVITIILRALGYDDSLPGQWPFDYVIKAKDLGITKKVAVVSGAANRGDVFLLLDNSLKVPMVSKDEDGNFVEKEDETLLAKIGFDKITGVMTAKANSDNEITLVDADGKEHVVIVPEDFDSEANFGLELTVWVNSDDEVELFEVNDTPLYDAVVMSGEKIKLVDANKKYAVADDATIYINGEEKDAPQAVDYAKVVLNSDDEVVFFDGYTWDDSLVVKDVDGDVVIGYNEIADRIELDVEDFTIVKNGKTITVDDIDTDDILFFNETAEYAEVFVSTIEGEIDNVFSDDVEVDGELYDYTTPNVTYVDANGKIKQIDSDALASMEEATLYLTRAGELRHVVGDIEQTVTTTVAGYLLDNATVYQSRNDNYIAIDMIDENGEVVALDVKVTASAIIETIKEWATTPGNVSNAVDLTWDDDNDPNTPEVNIQEETDWADYEAGEQAAIKDYYVNKEVSTGTVFANAGDVIEVTYDEDGDVSEVVFTLDNSKTAVTGLTGNNRVSTSAKYIADKRLTSNVVVFDVTAGTTSSKVKVTTWGEIENFDLIESAEIYYDSADYVTYLVVSAANTQVETTDYDVVVTEVKTDSDGELVRIKALVDGVEKTYYVDTDYTMTITPSVAQAVTITVDDNSGKLTDIKAMATPVVNAVVTSRNLKYNEITVAGSVYELVSDGYVYDITDTTAITEIDLRDIDLNEDLVKVVSDVAGTRFAKFILVTDVDSTTPATGTWSSSNITVEDNTGVDGFTVTLTAPTGLSLNDYIVAVYEGTTLIKIKPAAATVTFDSNDGVTMGKIYTVKVLKASDLSEQVSKTIADL